MTAADIAFSRHSNPPSGDRPRLTPRQTQVAMLVAQGLSRRAIAARLGEVRGKPLSIRTVDAHVRAIASLLPHDDLPAYRRVANWGRGDRRPENRA
jgi:DNA-binding NarL/FixJ family response regulator